MSAFVDENALKVFIQKVKEYADSKLGTSSTSSAS